MTAPPATAIPDELAAELGAALAAYGFAGPAEPVQSGLINRTFVVYAAGTAAGAAGTAGTAGTAPGAAGTAALGTAPGAGASTAADAPRPVAVLQRLHRVFAAEVNLDIEAVTAHLAACGLETPRLLATSDGGRWHVQPGGVWRALSYVPGTTLHRIEQPGTARAAAALCGRFHRALDTLAHDYAFARAGVHDTPAHLARLRERVEAGAPGGEVDRDAAELLAAARALGRDILDAAARLPPLADLPLRHTHGDLKISNVLFFPGEPERARCLVDLDTLGRQSLAYELGDAMRSWCNPRGEDEVDVHVDEAIFAAAMAGYREGAGARPPAAAPASIVPGLETVCVELAARFCRDVFDDSYFGWNPQRFPSRRAHNLIRAHSQLALARSVRAARRALAALV
jgi:Ser/Thr protein kinase RdoA (MazF antagonist)